MAKNKKTEEDWFLRGGERPSKPEPAEVDGGNPHDTDPCAECDGLTRCDDCPHNQDLIDNETGDEVEYDVSMVRTKTVRQRCRVTVVADCEESAMEKAEELAEDEGDGWPWEDEDNSTEYEDCEAESAGEL